jgi:hypothetical protein
VCVFDVKALVDVYFLSKTSCRFDHSHKRVGVPEGSRRYALCGQGVEALSQPELLPQQLSLDVSARQQRSMQMDGLLL